MSADWELYLIVKSQLGFRPFSRCMSIYDMILMARNNKLNDLIRTTDISRDFALGVINPHNSLETGPDEKIWNSLAREVGNCYKRFGSPLHWAVKNNNTHMIDFLLENGAYVDDNRSYEEGESPFFVAVCDDKETIAIKLLEYGADPYLKNKVVAKATIFN